VISATRRRILGGVTDQAVSSGTNFLTSLIAARLLTLNEYGTVVPALTIGITSIVVQRALVGDTLLAHGSVQTDRERSRLEHDALSSAGALGVICALVAIGVGQLPFAITSNIGWMGIWLPAVLVQDSYRYVFYSQRRPERALASDLAWAVVQVGALVAIGLLGLTTGPFVLGAWGGGALIGAVVGALLAHRLPIGGRPLRWARETRHLSGWFAGQVALSQGQSQVIRFFLGTFLRLSALAGFQAIQSLLIQPAQALLLAMQALLVPTLGRLVAAGKRAEVRALTRKLTGVFAAAGAVLAVTVFLLRRPLIEFVFTAKYLPYAGLLLPAAIATLFYAARTPYTAACRGLQNARGTFTIQAISTCATLPACILGSIWFGVIGATWGYAVGSMVLFISAVVVYHRTFKRVFLTPTDPAAPGDEAVLIR
jgi:O-antigen/teichoic acid export membrane protein